MRGFPLTGDDSRHTRSFGIKARADGWLRIIQATPNCYDAWMEDLLVDSIDFNAIMSQAAMKGDIPAVLEIDQLRGVIYVHNAINGSTALRICGLKGERLDPPIDITIAALTDSRDVIIAAGGSQE